MSAPSVLPLPAARVAAVAEALYALLPAHVRLRDRASGGALRALVGVLALPSAEIDAETDAFYDALFVETAGPAALDAIAALVAATPLRAMPPGAAIDQRAYVANTVRYRRGKGTARVLEALAADVTGLGAVAVEYFQRLARLNHLLDVRPDRPGTALLVDGDTAARAGGAFDLLPRLLDVRPVTRAHRDRPAGRHGITAIGVHVVRPVAPTFPAPPAAPGTAVPASSLAGVPVARPWPPGGVATPGYYQLAAQPGAPLRLFGPDRRADAGGGRLRERDLGDRLRRLPLHQETDELRRAFLEGRPPRLPDRPWFDEAGAPFTVFLRRSGDPTFTRVPPAQVRIANLENPPAPPGARQPATRTYSWFEPGPTDAVAKTGDYPVACAVDPVTGRIVVAEPAPGANDVAEVRVAYGTGLGRAVGTGAADRGDPEQPFEIRDRGGAVDLVSGRRRDPAVRGVGGDRQPHRADARWRPRGGRGRRRGTAQLRGARPLRHRGRAGGWDHDRRHAADRVRDPRGGSAVAAAAARPRRRPGRGAARLRHPPRPPLHRRRPGARAPRDRPRRRPGRPRCSTDWS